MNVYQRPLFRQMGGPVAPGMAAQEAMMGQPAPMMMGGQDPQAMLQQVEGQAAQMAQGVGEQYAQDMLSGIDAAETPEQIINALRGNEVPLQQRYAELAQFVGEADAQRTPESVLALVQPTIMMTEQGVMDSGIGDLMQRFVSDVEMETESGEPTAMGQGIGSLMMAGAPQPGVVEVGQQPVANFSQGGVVQRLQAGGEASRLQTLYSEMLPVYQGILGDGEDQRRMTQAQILFDIADRAGAFAAGIDPRTGQSVARLSPAAQLAAATSGLGGQIGQRLGSQEEQDRALRLAALQAAQGEFSAERAAARAAAAGGRDRALGSLYDVYDAKNNLVQQGVPIADRKQYDALIASVGKGARITLARAPETGSDITTLYGLETGEPVSFFTSSLQGRDQLQQALNSGKYVAVPLPKPGEQVILYDPANPEAGIPAIVGTPEYNRLVDAGYRTAQDITAQRELTTPAALTTYVNPEDNNDFVRVVPGSPEERAALDRNMVPVSDAVALAGLTPKPGEQVILYDSANPEAGIPAIVGTPEYNRLVDAGYRTAQDITAQRELTTPAPLLQPAPEAATLIERQRAAITDQSTLDNLETLSSQDLGRFAATVAEYIQETITPAGAAQRLPLPPNTQEAMRRAHAAGMSFPGVDPTAFGAAWRAEDFKITALKILDPGIDLRQATGLLAAFKRGFNVVGEQVADFVGGTGTAFVDTAEGSQALNSLAQATNRFYLAGRTLALEFSLLQDELVRPSAGRTDASAVRALTDQRGLLEGDVARLQVILNNPRAYTNADISTAREMTAYAQQLLLTYDDFIQAYGGPRPGDLPTLRQIMNNPANRIPE